MVLHQCRDSVDKVYHISIIQVVEGGCSCIYSCTGFGEQLSQEEEAASFVMLRHHDVSD